MNFDKLFKRPFPSFYPFPGPQSPVEEWLDTGSMDRVHETPFDKGFDRSISPFRPFLFLILPVKMLYRGPLTGQFSLSKPCQPTWVHAPGGPVSSVNEGSQIHSGLPGPYFLKCSKFPLKPVFAVSISPPGWCSVRCGWVQARGHKWLQVSPVFLLL